MAQNGEKVKVDDDTARRYKRRKVNVRHGYMSWIMVAMNGRLDPSPPLLPVCMIPKVGLPDGTAYGRPGHPSVVYQFPLRLELIRFERTFLDMPTKDSAVQIRSTFPDPLSLIQKFAKTRR